MSFLAIEMSVCSKICLCPHFHDLNMYLVKRHNKQYKEMGRVDRCYISRRLQFVL